MTTDDSDHHQEVGIIHSPTEHLLRELFPVGEIELDEKGQRDLEVVCNYSLLQHRVLNNYANREQAVGHVNAIRNKVVPFEEAIEDTEQYLKGVYFHLTELDLLQFHLFVETDLAAGLVIESQGPVQIIGGDPMRSAKAMTRYLANIVVSHALIRRYPQIRFPPSHYVIWSVDVHRSVATVTGYRDPFESSLNPDHGRDDF